MLRTVLTLSFYLLLGEIAYAQDPVHFADPNLKEAVEDELFVWDPTPDDMLGLTRLIANGDDWRPNSGIASLEGLEYATNLQQLRLRSNCISDISPLAGLVNLEELDVSNNQIADLSPLAGLEDVTYLNIHANRISDLSPVAGLTRVTQLIVRFNQIRDIRPIAGLTALYELDLGGNQISDISALSSLRRLLSLGLWDNRVSNVAPLSGLTELLELDIDINQITDLSPLANLVHLYSLDLENNLISDIQPLCGLTRLTYLNLRANPLLQEAYDAQIPQIIANNPGIFLWRDDRWGRLLSISSTPGGSVVDPGEGNFVYGYDSPTVRLEARAKAGFLFNGWSGDLDTMDNPTSITLNQDSCVRATFLSTREVLYVDDDAAADPNEDGSPAHPFDAIQEALAAAAPAAVILVYPGTYHEDIDFLDKDVRLIALDPREEGAGPCAVIEGTGRGPVVRFGERARSDCLLAGFVITGGRGEQAGAILCDGADPTIANCLIVGNRATSPNGAAVWCRHSQAALTNCTIADNYAGTLGAALLLIDSDVTMTDSILWGDTPHEILATGTSNPDIRYCGVEGWWADYGNIHADPLFARRGAWVDANDPDTARDPQDPQAVWRTGDYHLRSQAGRWDPDVQRWVQDQQTSPCIDAGLPESPVGHESAPNGKRINMGAYGGTAEASKSTAGQ